MAKYQLKVEIKAPDAEDGPGDIVPTIAEVEEVIERALAAAYPEAEVKAYSGERSDI